MCVGLNYHSHAIETGASPPGEPILFLKDPFTIVGPFDEIVLPRGSTKTDYEIELGVVVGKAARYLDSPADAAAVIEGYVLSCDLSEREFQLERGGQWDKGKSCETFNPLGPWIVPRHLAPAAFDLELRVNGDVRQKASTSDMIFDVDYLVWYISQFMVLRPGDLINTGTPAGVALGRENTPYLRTGDVVELEAGVLGSQQHLVVAPT